MNLTAILQSLVTVDSMGSVISRGVIWTIIAIIILISTDHPQPETSIKNLKANLGFFLLFICLSGGLIYLLFGFNLSS